MNIRDYPTLKDELLEAMVFRGIDETGDFDIFRLSLIRQGSMTDIFIGDMEDDDRLEICFDDIQHPDSFQNERGLDDVVNALRLNIINHLISKINDTFLDQMQPVLDQFYKERGEPSRLSGE